MRTITTNVYTFPELSDKAKEAAISQARDQGMTGDAWDSEWRDALKKACEAFNLTLKSWEVGAYSHSYCKVETGSEDLQGVRAWKYIQKNFSDVLKSDCPFTGYCGDEDFLDPIRDFLKKPDQRTLGKLFADCADSWAQAFRRDLEDQDSDEYIADHLEANEYEFTEQGKRI